MGLTRGYGRVVALVVLLALGLAASGWVSALDAQKISEMKADRETLWVFLMRLPNSFEAQIYYGLVISAAVGSVGSWLWKWSQGQADGLHHFTLAYVVYQLLWILGISIAALQTLGFQDDAGNFIGWLYVLWSGSFAGFSGEVRTSVKRTAP